jgi:predicted AAA+ superfamily ATPase
MDTDQHLIPRHVLNVARERAAASPVLLLQGPRSVGKSTVQRGLAQDVPGPIIDLGDPVVAEDARLSPSLMEGRLKHWQRSVSYWSRLLPSSC